MQAMPRHRRGLSPEPGLDQDQCSGLDWDRIQAVTEPYTRAHPNRERAGTQSSPGPGPTSVSRPGTPRLHLDPHPRSGPQAPRAGWHPARAERGGPRSAEAAPGAARSPRGRGSAARPARRSRWPRAELPSRPAASRERAAVSGRARRGRSAPAPGPGMQAVERDGAAGGPEGATGAGEAPPEPSPPKAAAAFDLLELVRSYRRLELYLEPLRDAAEGVRSLLRWQRPVCSLLVCLGLNFLLLTLGQAAWYSVLALLVAVPALLGYLQETCRARPSEPELVRRRYHSIRREDLCKVQLSRQEAIAQVKSFLIQLEGFLSGMCCSCEAVYRVLYWENPTVSSQFYGVLLGTICILYLLPLCWVLAILNSTLFLGNTQFYQVIMELKVSIEQCVGSKPLESTPEPAEPLPPAAAPDRTPTPTSAEDLTPGSVEEAEEAEPDEEFKDAIEENQLLVMEDDESSQCSADFDLSLPDNGFMSKNEVIRSKVSRLTERLRKRYPSNNFGNCTGCAATFSVLKKRRSCSNCGNSFCSRCCSFKVPKAVMGATAPEAQKETVFVCALCNQVLIK